MTTAITPICADCLANCCAGGEPDFPYRVTAAGDVCGAADCETTFTAIADARCDMASAAIEVAITTMVNAGTMTRAAAIDILRMACDVAEDI